MNNFADFFLPGLATILENGCQIQLSNDSVRTDLRICLVSEIDILRFIKIISCASIRSLIGLKQGITLSHFLELFQVKLSKAN